ncbi:hypothetical protein POX_c03808 [Penicillium oxalicum]|uniref:Uncharacterized protein n=1 Tax=Penicillium oxalicum (strain 114-2 / CGMCC 5302) TaxID=933388 RepID=S7Z4I3_PENO1|nr:hypothetical protein POX_c03808 [Penicillium oxalicum]EPS25415.1 hypothetical protein PDE_00348 [Penicillium oxalicum 114-2]KAI2790955.1 hypothetical protein POX_c03808 [Penicillium oxalicum]
MYFSNILTASVLGMASLSLALPRASKVHQGKPLAIRMAGETPSMSMSTPSPSASYAPTETGPTVPDVAQGTLVESNADVPNHVKHINHCLELCSLEAQTCNIAIPNDDQFCRETYTGCMERCRPDDFQ